MDTHRILAVMLITQIMTIISVSLYQSKAPSTPYSAEIPPLMRIISSLTKHHCPFITFTDSESLPDAIINEATRLQCLHGISIFKTNVKSGDSNTSDTFWDTCLMGLINKAEKIQQTSECLTVLLTSNDIGFLAAFIQHSLEGLLMMRTTRLIVLTHVTPHKLQSLTNEIPVPDTLLLVLNEKLEKLRVSLYVNLPHFPQEYHFMKISDSSVQKGIIFTLHSDAPEKFTRFKYGKKLLVVAEEYQPHTALDQVHGHQIGFTGPMVNLLNIMAKGLNFTYSFVRPPDGSWGTKRPDGSWSGMVGVVTRGEADLGLGPFAMSASRAEVIDYLRPILVDYIKIMGGRGRVKVDPWGFLLPLTSAVWVVLLGSLTAIALSMNILSSTSKSLSRKWSGLKNFSELIQVLLQQSVKTYDKLWWERLVLGVWLLMTFVLSRSYAGNLMSLLAVRHIPQPYQNLRDVLDDLRTTMIWETNTAYIQYINSVDMGEFQEVAEAGKRGRIQYKKGFEFPEVVDTLVREGDHVLMIEDLTARVLMAHLFSLTGQCDFYTSRDAYLPYFFAMIAKKNSQLTIHLNKQIRSVTEGGLYERWIADTIPNSTTCLSAPNTITVTSRLSLKNFWGLFVLLPGGFLFASLVLCIEIFAGTSFSEH